MHLAKDKNSHGVEGVGHGELVENRISGCGMVAQP